MTENRDINYREMLKNPAPNNYTSACVIVPLLFDAIAPESIIDIGCGTGTWLYVCKKKGAKKIQGVDGEWIRSKNSNLLMIDERELEIYDFDYLRGGGVKCVKDNHYDMAICLEMAEHVSRKRADYLIDTLTGASDVIFFSAANPYSGGIHHVNEQWQSYWIHKFAARGFLAVDYIRPKVWNDRAVCHFYAEESFVFIKRDRLAEFPLLEKAYSVDFIADVVHPMHFMYQSVGATHDWPYLFGMQKRLMKAYFNKAKSEWKNNFF